MPSGKDFNFQFGGLIYIIIKIFLLFFQGFFSFFILKRILVKLKLTNEELIKLKILEMKRKIESEEQQKLY
jgi:hypothetical protein